MSVYNLLLEMRKMCEANCKTKRSATALHLAREISHAENEASSPS